MKRRGAGLLALVALTACPGTQPGLRPAPDPTSESTAPTSGANTSPLVIEATEVARGLDTVWAIAFAPDGSMHATERGGTIRSWNVDADGSFVEAASREVRGVVESGEAGLMGLAIDAGGRKFVMYTAARENRVVRLGPDGSQTVLVDGIAAGSVHDGGRLVFGPDGMLYASTGDAGDPSTVAAARRNGKVLRIHPETGRTEVFTTGHRNPQGLCFSAGGKLFSTEHGPDGGDEVNVLEEGRDYGWPETAGTGLVNYTPSIAPAGCAVYEADLIRAWKGDLLFGTLRGESLWRLDLDPAQESVSGQERLHRGDFGRIRDVVVGPDGAVYLATSNRDGRGEPRDGDDRIIRLTPKDRDDPSKSIDF